MNFIVFHLMKFTRSDTILTIGLYFWFNIGILREVKHMTKIKGKNDGPGGRNEHYDIGNRKNVPRRNAVAEVKRGEHPGAHVMKINNREYVRDNPDSSKKDNVNRNK